MTDKISFKTWNKACQICGSNDVSELQNIYFPYHSSGYICSNCDRIYEFEEVKIAMKEHEDYLMEDAITGYLTTFFATEKSRKIFEKVYTQLKNGGA